MIVVGAGAAGVSAAISAARFGAEVLLLENRPRVGGTVTHSLIHTLGGLFDSEGDYLNAGMPVELVQRLERKGQQTYTPSMLNPMPLTTCEPFAVLR